MTPFFILALLLQAAAPPQLPVPQDEPLTMPAIVYPADAATAHIEGVVHIEIDVDPTGHVTAVRALDGPEQLRQAAIDAYAKATYRPLVKDGVPTPAIISTAVNFSLTEAPPTDDTALYTKFQVQHGRCQVFSAAHNAAAPATCREALAISQQFAPGTRLDARTAAYNDLVLLLIAPGKKSPDLAEATQLANGAVDLVSGVKGNETPAVAVAYITRAEVRSLADDPAGAAADCGIAEETLTTLLQNQAKPTANEAERTEIEKAGNYRVQLRETLLLHAQALDRQHKGKEAKELRARAATM